MALYFLLGAGIWSSVSALTPKEGHGYLYLYLYLYLLHLYPGFYCYTKGAIWKILDLLTEIVLI